MSNLTFPDFTLASSPVLTDYLVGYRTNVIGGERRTALTDILTLFKQNTTTGSFVLTGNGSGGFTNTDLTYSTPNLTTAATSLGVILTGTTGVTSMVLSDTSGVWQRGLLVVGTGISHGVHSVNYRNASGGAAYLTNAMAEGTQSAPTTLGTSVVTGGYLGYAYAAGDFREMTRIASITSTTFSDTDWSGQLRFYTHIANATGGATLSLELSGAASCSLTGGAGNMTITGGTGASRTLTLRTTTSGSTATNALVLDATQGATFSGAIIATPQALSGAGAVNLTTACTDFTSTGSAQALTLANGTAGQIKTITHVVDGGSGVLTPTTKIGFTTVTFTNVGDSVTLRYTAQGWAVIGISGAVLA